MMCAPFRQEIDKEGSELGVVETRHGLAIHYDVIRNALVSARGIDVIGARAGAYNTVSHCSALWWLGEQGVSRTLFRRSPRIRGVGLICLVLVYDLAQQIGCHGFRRRGTELSCFASVFSIYRDHPANDHILASERLAATLNRNTSRPKAI
jgi:hypothetical protein